jgi:hypothetical protein
MLPDGSPPQAHEHEKIWPSTQPAFAMPAARVDRRAGLADGATAVSRASHSAHPVRIIEIIWQICMPVIGLNIENSRFFMLFLQALASWFFDLMMSIGAVSRSIDMTHNASSLRCRYPSRLSAQSTIEKCIERLDNGVRIVTRLLFQ